MERGGSRDNGHRHGPVPAACGMDAHRAIRASAAPSSHPKWLPTVVRMPSIRACSSRSGGERRRPGRRCRSGPHSCRAGCRTHRVAGRRGFRRAHMHRRRFAGRAGTLRQAPVPIGCVVSTRSNLPFRHPARMPRTSDHQSGLVHASLRRINHAGEIRATPGAAPKAVKSCGLASSVPLKVKLYSSFNLK